MRACEPSRPVLGRFHRAIVAPARVRAAPSAVAAATGTLARTFDDNTARTIAPGGESLMQISVRTNDSAGHSNILPITTSRACRSSRCNIRDGRICGSHSTPPPRSTKAASSNSAEPPEQRSRQGIRGPE